MTKLETIKLCAKAIGLKWTEGPVSIFVDWPNIYDPLHDDAQAMALVKKFKLSMSCFPMEGEDWAVSDLLGTADVFTNANLNHAICECVAKMEKSK